MSPVATAAVFLMTLGPGAAPLVRSGASGPWSRATTWEGGRTPRPGDRVQVRAGHTVTFDATIDEPIRSIHIAGTLSFDPDRDTRLSVGLIKIQAGDDPSEAGFDCEAHGAVADPALPRPALEVGTRARPIAAGRTALIRLAPVPGLDPEECPAIVCCGGRMDLHGAPLNRTWVKLGASAAPGDSALTLAEPVQGWRVGDRVIVTATKIRHVKSEAAIESVLTQAETEERTVQAIDGARLTLDAPLAYKHAGAGVCRGEVADLSRNVVVESADPGGVRGHTMYHRHSAGSISYVEFRHLGKVGKLGKYSLHFHRAGDTMRGTSVVGASIWDSGNRWITIHGTNDLVVRDCVGYRSAGHGFFLEDGTEVDNILDRNLAVQAVASRPLPGQALPFDRNDGAGFWWANCGNSFTRNVAAECDGYGFRFDAPESPDFDPVRLVRGPDGQARRVDVRTLPFLRFEANEAHAQRRYGVNLGGGPGDGARGGVGKVGPDVRHPFEVRDLRVWESLWAFTPAAPCILVDRLAIDSCAFGLWRPIYDRHAYRGVDAHLTVWAYYAETGPRVVEASFPAPLDPIDDRPPVTVVTHTVLKATGGLIIHGVAADNGTIRAVRVNGRLARSLAANFADWEVELDPPRPGPFTVNAAAEDRAGNVEATPHTLIVEILDSTRGARP